MKLKIFGCTVVVSPGFCCIITLLLLVDQTDVIGLMLLGVLIHELGHCMWMALFGCLPDSIRFSPFEIDMVCSRTPSVWYQQLFIALGGILANLVCVCLSRGQWQRINLFFAIFNGLPIFSMDGYQVLSLCFLPVIKKKRWLNLVSGITLVFLGIAGVWYWLRFHNPLLFLFVLYMLLLQIRAKSG